MGDNAFKNASVMTEDQLMDFVGQEYGVGPEEASRLIATANFARNWTHATSPETYMTNLGGQEPAFLDWAKGSGISDFDISNPFPVTNIRGFWSQLMKDPNSISYKGVDPSVSIPPAFDTPYSGGFGPRSQYWKP